jgi:hypothetical protein
MKGQQYLLQQFWEIRIGVPLSPLAVHQKRIQQLVKRKSFFGQRRQMLRASLSISALAEMHLNSGEVAGGGPVFQD